MAAPGEWEPVIGLEVHAQLLTRTKLFCACRTSFGSPPNTHVCPTCLGLPGSLPVLNGGAVRLAVRASLALGCTVHDASVFSRKNYFYPDLPKGYQISQYDRPLATDGELAIEVGGERKVARIQRIHMEEDAGKTIHGAGGSDRSIVDLNRAGTPLCEIVGHPDLRSAAEAGAYLRAMRDVLVFAQVNDGNLEQGSFRADANVSVRRRGDTSLGTRTELKNINSFRFVEEAIEVEVRRQVVLLESGERVRQQTRGYNADKRETYLLRDKENEAGYRYFPEPDLPILRVDDALRAAVRAETPELPAPKRRRYEAELGLSPSAAATLSSHPAYARFFEAGVAMGADPPRLANFVLGEVLRDAESTGSEARFAVSPSQVVEILALVAEGKISGKQAKDVYARVAGGDRSPRDVVAAEGLAVLSDEGALLAIAREIVAANARQAAQFRAGKENLLGFFVGQIMKRTGGSADPRLASDLARRALADAPPDDAAGGGT
jgi:aspartyl-tRNA(Asn)/glutamyl-tRNA(Gln) amidotransferase subunit B